MRPLFRTASALLLAWPAQAAADWSDWSLSPTSFVLGDWTGSIGASVSGAAYWADQPRPRPGLTGSVLITPHLTNELANGWEIDAHAALLVYRDELSGDIYDNRLFQIAYVSLQTQYGRLELGQQDGAAYALSVVGPKVVSSAALDAASLTFFRNPGTGKPLIDVFRLVTGEFATENFAKISYYSPRLYGVELGGSFTPYQARNGLPFAGQGVTVADRQTRLLEAAVNYDADLGPFNPWGANDGKVVDSEMVRDLAFWARWGHPCGRPFDAQAFMLRHPQWNWLNGYMRDRPSWPWTRFDVLRPGA